MEMCRRDPVHWINNWVWTYDPRAASQPGALAHIPFDLYQRQVELVRWLEGRLTARAGGLVEKSRDVGFTWLVGSFAVHHWLFRAGFKTAFGSRKGEYVDRLGDPDSIFEKLRMIIDSLPPFMKPQGYNRRIHDNSMQLYNPETKNTIRGEAGDEMGRGGRSTLYVIDEGAFVEHGDTVDAATGSNADVVIWASTVNGMANTFAVKRHAPTLDPAALFTFHWRDDPRKDDAWAAAKRASYSAPHIFASEYDIDYRASVAGGVIPSVWLASCVDACRKLGIERTGSRRAALDVADQGNDLNALAISEGVELIYIEDWSGKGSDILFTAQRAFVLCDEYGVTDLRYDADGLGAGIRGDARMLNERRSQYDKIDAVSFQGSESPAMPEAQAFPEIKDGKGRKNKDFFKNRKAQGWWALRQRAQKTYRWVVEGVPCDPDDILSISSKSPNCQRLLTELTQPTYTIDNTGKIVVDKTPEDTRSPNLADACMMLYAPAARPRMNISLDAIRSVR